MAEVTHLVPAGNRPREVMVTELAWALGDLIATGALSEVRYEIWWDPEAPEIWMRTTSGPRIRITVTVEAEGVRVLVRGPLGIRLRRPAVVRRLMELLAGD